MMSRSRWAIRLLLLTIILTSLLSLTSSYLAFQGRDLYRYENPEGKAEEADEITVVTTAPSRSRRDGQLVAFNGAGNPIYHNSSFDFYFDVDPVPNRTHTVLYSAGEFLNPDECGARPASGHCTLVVVEQLNLTTGNVTRLYERHSRPQIIHDVDRINGSHLLIADIANHRVFIVDTRSGITTWAWPAQANYSVDGGGFFPDDWTHLNDVELLEDGRIMVSLRNQDQVVFIDKRRGLLENWTLGSENDYDILYEQHNPDYIPKRNGGPAILVADSENNRVVEYQRSSTGGWIQTWEWQDARLQWPRDADRLPNGNTLIVDSNGNRVLEVDQAGEVVWEVGVDTPYDAERLGTGPGSTGGQSAQRLDLTPKSSGQDDTSESTGGQDSPFRESIKAVWLVVKSILPGPIVNAFFFVLPRWAGFPEILFIAIAVGTSGIHLVVEFRWSRYQLRSPIYSDSDRSDDTRLRDWFN